MGNTVRRRQRSKVHVSQLAPKPAHSLDFGLANKGRTLPRLRRSSGQASWACSAVMPCKRAFSLSTGGNQSLPPLAVSSRPRQPVFCGSACSSHQTELVSAVTPSPVPGQVSHFVSFSRSHAACLLSFLFSLSSPRCCSSSLFRSLLYLPTLCHFETVSPPPSEQHRVIHI